MGNAGKPFQISEHVLGARLTAHRLSGAVETVRRLRAWGPGSTIRGLAGDLGMSQRQLVRVFTERGGLGPKWRHRVLRFQRVIMLLDTGARASWARLVIRCGYFDQAHLIRDFRALMVMTPTQYSDLRSPDPNFALAQ